VTRGIEQRIAHDLSLDVTVLIRTRDELAEVIGGNPFLEQGADPANIAPIKAASDASGPGAYFDIAFAAVLAARWVGVEAAAAFARRAPSVPAGAAVAFTDVFAVDRPGVPLPLATLDDAVFVAPRVGTANSRTVASGAVLRADSMPSRQLRRVG
jgi:hypothetical protein